MEYKQYNLEEIQNMFDKERNPEELNKIIGAMVNKQDILSNDNEETNDVQLEEEMYQQMNLIKLEDLNIIHLQEVRRQLDKKYGKMIFDDEITEIGE